MQNEWTDSLDLAIKKLRSYDKTELRRRLEQAKSNFSKAQDGRKEERLCFEVTGSELLSPTNENHSRLIRCRRPGEFRHWNDGWLCREHFEEKDPQFKQAVASQRRQFRFRFNGAIHARVKYILPTVLEMLENYILFHIIDDENLCLSAGWGGSTNSYDWNIYRSGACEAVISSYMSSDQFDMLEVWLIQLMQFKHILLKEGFINENDLDWIHSIAIEAEYHLIWRLNDKLQGVIEQICRESVFYAFNEAISESEYMNLLRLTELRDGDKIMGLNLRPRGGSQPRRKLDGIKKVYDRLSNVWDNAKTDALEAQKHPLKRERWRSIIKATYAPYDLLDDLIEWLNISSLERSERLGAFSNMPKLQARLEKGYVLSMPSHLALEHAARLCYALPYEYSVRTLSEKARMETNGADDITNDMQ